MPEIEVGFCRRCSEKIRNPKLRKYWQASCLNFIQTASCRSFKESDDHMMLNLYLLEKKNLIVTTEHYDEVYFKPLGINQESNEFYSVCISPLMHFTETE